MTTTAPRTRTGCTSCRVRHLKCDEARPVCRRCQRAGRECVRGYNVRFRYGTDLEAASAAAAASSSSKGAEFRFEADQVWIDTSGQVSFVDETRDVTRNYDGSRGGSGGAVEDEDPLSSPPRPSSRAVAIESLLSSPTNSVVHSPTDDALPRELQIGMALEPRRLQLSDILIRDEEEDQQDDHHHPRQCIWPLTNVRDAEILRHYVTHLAQWYDMHDPYNHFATSVPLLSATCPMLLNAMLALAARHLSISSDLDPLVALQYHQACLQEYIPSLSSMGQSNSKNDSVLLAATVLLRTFEELDGRDDENYLVGGSRLFSTRLASEGGLRQACFWIYLRQDIYIAFVKRRPVRTDLDHPRPQQLDGADDWTTANRITLIAAEILRFAHGNTPAERTLSEWRRLKAAVETWFRNRPAGFRGIYHIARDAAQARYWPEAWFTLDCHASGTQYYHLCQILLSLYNPGLPSISSGPTTTRDATEKVADEVRRNVRAIVGVAIANRAVAANFTACHAVAVCGGWFEDRLERQALMQVLVRTEKEFGWPTGAARTAWVGEEK
ncbi:hypothetical protein FN846DRAFT_953207 [Sphaerosporella brunnea]|uniref:Zn(2)-C6 fungal-type domain-containing protein n=1 Tax=Sphaerosporella brunnea TaxID=1250544 RepID=A0A5J5EUK6_9PEZI|nr:hypothetical protein FN846DRAFT_953207 [Sphaerosporella brunnea]